MVNRRTFKSDVSFLEKISMGATGTIAVFNNLGEQGHTPIELERGSRSFKIWKNIKITPEIIHEFPLAHPAKRSGISWALSKAGKFTLQDIYKLEEY